MTDQTTTLAQIKRHIQNFSDARGWRKGQNAKDLAMALTVEAAELQKKTHENIRYDPAPLSQKPGGI